MLYYAPLYQGEGISGPAGVGAGTSALYSCIGVAFANRGRRIGGLYHYPAGTLRYASVRATIEQMAHDIQPDLIVVTPAGGVDPFLSSRGEDISSIQGLLRSLCPNASIERAAAGVSAQIVWDDSGPRFNRQPFEVVDDFDGETLVGGVELRSQRSSLPRQIADGVFYYGVNAETYSLGSRSPSEGSAAGPSGPVSSNRSRFKKGSRRKWIKERCTVM